MLQLEKTQWKYWTQWTLRPLKNAKIQTKTHEMDVLEAVENETLESHSGSRGFERYRVRAHKNEQQGSFCFIGSSLIKTTKKQAILLERKAPMPKIMACYQNPKVPPLNQRGGFLFKLVRCREGVPNRMVWQMSFSLE